MSSFFDAAGNRTNVVDSRTGFQPVASTYSVNSLNQYTDVTAPTNLITVTGYVEPGPRSNKWYASTAAVSNQQSAVSQQDGTFAIPNVPVTPGTNTLAVTVTDVSGNVATQVVNFTVGTTVSYDANGNQTSSGAWTMTYDRENRLIAASSQSSVVSYQYDALGRLIERRTSGTTASTNHMYYAGWQLIAEYDGAGALQRKYVYGPGIDEPVRMTLTASPLPLAYYFHADGLGSVTEISSAAGQLVERYRYDVYGTPTFQNASGAAIASSAIGNRLLFTARDRDPDTTWYNYRYRYYNPTLGRFPQPDPVGLAGRDVNLYRYVENNPSSLTDPLGLATYFAGMNLDYYGMFGGEGGAGYYVDTETPTKGTSFDMGFYSSGGGGVGWNTSAGFLTFGGVAGNRSAFTGEALNFSVGGPYVTGTIICDPNQKGNVFGFKPIGASITLGPGYPLLNVAASKTWTKAWSLYQWVDRKVEQFTKWIRR